MIGQKLIGHLSQTDHEVFAASPSTGVDTVTGKGLDRILENAQIVVDVSQPPILNEQAALEFFVPSNKNLLAAERQAGVQQHLALSVVGLENLGESGYFRGKIAQEELIKSGAIPYILIRSTQFFEFIGSYLRGHQSDGKIRVPPLWVQPIGSEEVAWFLARAISQSQVNTTIEIAGPKRFTLEDWAKAHCRMWEDAPEIMVDERATFLGAKIGPNMLLPSNTAKIGKLDYGEWWNGELGPENSNS